jgi:hypothetical protein
MSYTLRAASPRVPAALEGFGSSLQRWVRTLQPGSDTVRRRPQAAPDEVDWVGRLGRSTGSVDWIALALSKERSPWPPARGFRRPRTSAQVKVALSQGPPLRQR